MNTKTGEGTLRGLGIRYSLRNRARRAALFRSAFTLTPETQLLDLGGGTGAHINLVLKGTPVRAENVCVADVGKRVAQSAEYGYRPVMLEVGKPLPFNDGEFDIVFCSSVIEHVIPRPEMWTLGGEEFARRSIFLQRAFADELRRIAKGYWVQTPARSFFLEPHSGLPFVGWLPRRAQLAIFRLSCRYWVSRHLPDFYALTRGHMEALFPDAKIIAERSLGMVKSWVAAREPPAGLGSHGVVRAA